MSASADRFAGLILAGGAGSRYGQPKAWAVLPDGRTFLEACAESLSEGGAAPLAATLPVACDGSGIEGLEAVPLPEPNLDMFASLRAGLRFLLEDEKWRRVVVLPVDHPLIRPETVAALANRRGSAVVPSHRGRRGHPVVVDRAVAEAIDRGEHHGRTLRGVLHLVGPEIVAIDDPGIVANCNTPDVLVRSLATGNRVR